MSVAGAWRHTVGASLARTLGRMQAVVVVIVASGTASIALFIALQRHLGKLKPSLFWAQVTFTERQFRAVVEQWGPEGFARFRTHFALDYLFLASYGTFGFTLGLWLQSQSTAAPVYEAIAMWALPVAAVFDAIENMLHQRFAIAAPYSLPKIAFFAAGASSTTKWVLSLAFPLLAAWVALRNAA